jgi:hypothetical protein
VDYAYSPRTEVHDGPFGIEPVRVIHSTPIPSRWRSELGNLSLIRDLRTLAQEAPCSRSWAVPARSGKLVAGAGLLSRGVVSRTAETLDDFVSCPLHNEASSRS